MGLAKKQKGKDAGWSAAKNSVLGAIDALLLITHPDKKTRTTKRKDKDHEAESHY